MPRKCLVCSHINRNKIDELLLDGKPYRSITKQFNINESSVYRHGKHIERNLIKAKEVEQMADADSLMKQIKQLHQKALELLSKAESENDYRTALTAIREARGCLEVLAKLSGELNDNPTINILLNPQYIEFRALVINVLDEYPEASNFFK